MTVFVAVSNISFVLLRGSYYYFFGERNYNVPCMAALINNYKNVEARGVDNEN